MDVRAPAALRIAAFAASIAFIFVISGSTPIPIRSFPPFTASLPSFLFSTETQPLQLLIDKLDGLNLMTQP